MSKGVLIELVVLPPFSQWSKGERPEKLYGCVAHRPMKTELIRADNRVFTVSEVEHKASPSNNAEDAPDRLTVYVYRTEEKDCLDFVADRAPMYGLTDENQPRIPNA